MTCNRCGRFVFGFSHIFYEGFTLCGYDCYKELKTRFDEWGIKEKPCSVNDAVKK